MQILFLILLLLFQPVYASDGEAYIDEYIAYLVYINDGLQSCLDESDQCGQPSEAPQKEMLATWSTIEKSNMDGLVDFIVASGTDIQIRVINDLQEARIALGFRLLKQREAKSQRAPAPDSSGT